jgi:serine/threonine protein kinase
VWFCRDLQRKPLRYVSLKILMADMSGDDCRELNVYKLKEAGLDQEVGGKYICLPLDQFKIDGPNGSHLCFVYPVAGPRVSRMVSESEDPDRLLRDICLQVTQAVAALHSRGICHGGKFIFPQRSASTGF